MAESTTDGRIGLSRIVAPVILVGGVLLSAFAFHAADEVETARARSVLELRAEWRAGDIQARISDASVPVEALADFIPSQLVLDPDEFRRFTIQARRDEPLARLIWAPLVRGADRAGFEANARLAGDVGYTIFEVGPNGRRPAAERDEYLPISLERVFGTVTPALGFDLLSDKVRATLAAEARDTGRPAAVPPRPLAGSADAAPNYLIFWPIYATRRVPSTVAERRAAFSGLVVGVYPFDALMEFAIAGSRQTVGTLNLFIDRPARELSGIPLARVEPGTGRIALPKDSLGVPRPGAMRLTRTFSQFDHDWTVVSDYGPGVVNRLRGESQWGYLASGLLITFCVTAYLGMETQRRRSVEAEIVKRTRQLQDTTTQLQAIFDSSPVALVVFDPGGTVMTWNRAAERISGYDAAEVVGRGMPAAFLMDDDTFAQRLGRVQRGEVLHGAESRRRRKDGTVIETMSSVAGLFDAKGSLQSIIAATEDISDRKRVEQRERDLLERLDAVVEAAPDGIVTIDSRGNVLDFNTAAVRLFGYEADEIVGRNVRALMPARFAQEHDGYLDNYRRTGERKIIGIGRDVEGLRKDGTTFPMRLSVGEARQGGEVIFVGIVHDLTRSRASEAALRQTQTLLSAIVSSSDDAMISKTLEGIVTTWNRSAEQIFGYSSEEMIGQSISVLAVPGDLDDMRQVLDRIKRNERIDHYETMRRRKDGTVIDVSLTVSPIHDADGRLIGASKIVRDITAAKAAASALLASEIKYRSTFDIAPVGIIHLSPTGDFLAVNDFLCNLLGYARDELVSMNVLAITDPTDIGPSQDQFAHVRSGAAPTGRFTKRYRRKGGDVAWCEVSYTGQYDDARQLSYIISIISDISARVAAEDRQRQLTEQLQQAQKMEAIGQLTGGMAHDFNNLLGVVLGNLDFLEEKFAAGSDELQLTRSAMKAALHGAELTRALLAFARRQPLAAKLTDLASVLETAAQLFRRTLGENIALEVRMAEDLWRVRIDVSQIESAILNLAVNARDAMPQGGSLTIEARNLTLDEKASELNPEAAPGDFVVIAISDTGTGMPPEVIAKAFDPFFTTKGSKGTGLGLSMVHGFIKQSGGYSRIYSEPGRGTTIRLYLPRAEGDENGAVDGESAADLANGDEVILVVEDNTALRDIVVRRLHELGYRTIPARDAADALAIIQGGISIDLLFTDVVMPGGMDGRALAEAARRLRPDLKVLFTSGFTAAAASAAMTDEFGFNLLTKPYRKEDLARRVRAILDGPDGQIS